MVQALAFACEEIHRVSQGHQDGDGRLGRHLRQEGDVGGTGKTCTTWPPSLLENQTAEGWQMKETEQWQWEGWRRDTQASSGNLSVRNGLGVSGQCTTCLS